MIICLPPVLEYTVKSSWRAWHLLHGYYCDMALPDNIKIILINNILETFSVAKATLESQMSVRPSVRLSVSLLPIAKIVPISHHTHQAYHPSNLSTIKPINHQTYWPLNLLTIKPNDNQTYRQSHLTTIEPIDNRAYQQLSLSTIESIGH